jgi:hypothetical protein
MLKLYIILLFIVLISSENTYCQQSQLSENLRLTLSDKNSKNKFHLFEAGSLRNYDKLNSSLIGNKPLKNKFQVKVKRIGVDPDYVKRYPLWVPITEIIGEHIGVNLFSSYVLNNEYSKISFESIKHNFETGFVWDSDFFTTNFFAHPFNGSNYFDIARSNGYSYLESIPFTIGGSLTWELFMETDPPQTNDLIMTSTCGVFLGEVLHRLSSLVIDDSKTGFERVVREIGAGLIDIPRGFNRVFQAKSWNVETVTYERTPLALNAYYGVNWNNYGTKIGTGIANGVAGFGLIYGNPFENRKRAPMDFFRFAGNFNFGAGQPPIGNLEGYGSLYSKTHNYKNKRDYMLGIFQHYDFFENQAYEIGALSFGAGWISRYKTSKNSLFVSAAHLNLMPFGGTKSQYVDVNLRNYSFAGGFNAKVEGSLNYKWGSFYAGYNIYWYYIYVGVPGNEWYGIFRPKAVININKNLGIGAQFMFAHKSGHYKDYPDVNGRTSQTMLLLQYTFGDMNFLKESNKK